MRHWNRNADEGLRELERQASQGDEEAAARWTRSMAALGRAAQIPVGYLRYLPHDQLMSLIGSTHLANASLSYWIHVAGDRAFRLHEQWAGEDGAYGPRRTLADRQLLRRFALWARVWCCLLFMRDIVEGVDPLESELAAAASILAGSRVQAHSHEDLAFLPRDAELDAMIVAMFG